MWLSYESTRGWVCIALVCSLCVQAERAYAQEEEAPEAPQYEREPRYRNPQGSLAISGSFGVGVSSDKTVVGIGLGVGYAVLTGVLPGIRGMIIAGNDVGGEAALTLTLTPPLDFTVVPFAIGETGRRWEPNLSGWIYGAGAGLYIGEPDSAFGLQAGWIFRRFDTDVGSFDLSGPIVAVSFRL